MQAAGGYVFVFTLMGVAPVALSAPAFLTLYRYNSGAPHFRDWGIAYAALTAAIGFGALSLWEPGPLLLPVVASQTLSLVCLGLFYYFHAVGSLRYVKAKMVESLAAMVSIGALALIVIFNVVSPDYGLMMSSIVQLLVYFWEGAILRREGLLGRAFFYACVGRGLLSVWRPVAIADFDSLFMYTTLALAFTSASTLLVMLLAIERDHSQLQTANQRLTLQNALIGRQSATLQQVAVDLSREQLRAAQADNARQDFLSGINHEFRTPLNAVMGFSSVIMATKSVSSDVRQFASNIYDAGARILAHFEKIQTVKALDAAYVSPPEAVDVQDLLASIKAFAADHPMAVGIEVEIEDRGEVTAVHADRANLENALRQLVDNAVLYTPLGEKVILTCRPTELGQAVIEITDRGPGFDANVDFDNPVPFVRGSSHAGLNKPGLGLGLFIARNMLEASGVRLTRRDHPQGGTIVTLTLPASLAKTKPAKKSRKKTV
ncbi:HAMP domain-containing sensor histidine kinase [Caulobacter sp. SL161]|uniref:sensor histidine kinase n=1 Tax=Caulobacter sp. SL161 TaxID=2995156 RepID=UPI00227403AD|nr:HAMP domain-containing sensor histidine kinase [Caulobacter sp. SL161]MCY1648797.1 HAMP domain-containing sensor histidine kinase [Caulobacter sp. SL161]